MKNRFYKGKSSNPDAGIRVTEIRAELEVTDAGTFPIHKVATIGRDPGCDIVLEVSSISRRHARIFYEGGHFWIKDLDSANGIQVNGKRTKLQMLDEGDEVSFGLAKASFHIMTQLSSPSPLGKEPLADMEATVDHGTSIGGLGPVPPSSSFQEQRIKELEATVEKLCQEVEDRQSQLAQMLRKLEVLETENELLRREIAQSRGPATVPISPSATQAAPDSSREKN